MGRKMLGNIMFVTGGNHNNQLKFLNRDDFYRHKKSALLSALKTAFKREYIVNKLSTSDRGTID